MFRLVLFSMISLALVSCGGSDDTKTDKDQYSFAGFSEGFKEVSVPFHLTDTMLLANKDTTTLTAVEFTSLIPDSLKSKLFGKSQIRYAPLAKVKVPDAETYLVVKASSGNKKSAILLVYDKDGNHGATFPFLVPDNESATSQVSMIEKSFVVTKLVTKRSASAVKEGKDVFAYDAPTKTFNLIMTDPLEENNVLINPIDTLPRSNKYSGDYHLGQNAVVSIRDGRSTQELMAFVHFKKEGSDCRGELKGQLFFTSSTTAVYRQSGDPCIIQFSFKGSSVTLKEETGCGNHRGIDCVFDGTYTKKKPKPAPKKKK